MNIVEAMQAAQRAGKTCIAHEQMNGNFTVIQPTGEEERCICGIFGPNRPLSYAYTRWSPTIADLTSKKWLVPDMKEICSDPKQNPAEKPDRPIQTAAQAVASLSATLASLTGHEDPMSKTTFDLVYAPVHREDFKKALKEAKVKDLFDALTRVEAQLKNGEKVKSRHAALDAEFQRKKESGKKGKEDLH